MYTAIRIYVSIYTQDTVTSYIVCIIIYTYRLSHTHTHTIFISHCIYKYIYKCSTSDVNSTSTVHTHIYVGRGQAGKRVPIRTRSDIHEYIIIKRKPVVRTYIIIFSQLVFVRVTYVSPQCNNVYIYNISSPSILITHIVRFEFGFICTYTL